MADDRATSILEFLTHLNPDTTHEEPKSKTQTKNPKRNFLTPARVKRWEEFENLDILKSASGGRLLEAACAERQGGRSLPSYPFVFPEDKKISQEEDAKLLIHEWYRKIVVHALTAVDPQFNSLLWRPGSRSHEGRQYQLLSPIRTRSTRSRSCSQAARNSRSTSTSRTYSDAGSISRDSSATGIQDGNLADRPEKFPKEYKAATKWQSQWVDERELIDDEGKWRPGSSKDPKALPIRQAFTQCVDRMCRYGCLLTDREAFIFQVSSLDAKPRTKLKNLKKLEYSISNNGLMEYVSIPHSSHWNGDISVHNTWTINLALWFMHILAAHGHEVDWTYPSLIEHARNVITSREIIPEIDYSPLNKGELEGREAEVDEPLNPESSDSENSDKTIINPPFRGKRKRSHDEEDEDEDDHPAHSFDSRSTRRNLRVL